MTGGAYDSSKVTGHGAEAASIFHQRKFLVPKGVGSVLNIRRKIGFSILIFPVLLACSLALQAQDKDSFSPMPLDSGFGKMDVTPPPVPAEQIIKQFAAKESEFQDALNHYTYRRYARVQTLDDDNKVDGEWYEVDDVIFDSAGRRTEKVVFAPGSSLQRVMMSPSDLQDISHGYPFVLTTEDIPQYDVSFVGRQKVDEVDCYVFEVSAQADREEQAILPGPHLGRRDRPADRRHQRPHGARRHAQGQRRSASAIHDVARTGRWSLLVPCLHQGRRHSALLRRQRLHRQDVHIRDTMKYTDYKRFGSTSKIIYGGQTVPDANQQQSAPTKKK